MPTSEQYSIFRAYLDARHRDGGMADTTVLDYAMMVEDSHVETRIIEYRRRTVDSGITGKGGDLIAVALTDILSDGLSMVYSFFEPSEESRSLGTLHDPRPHRPRPQAGAALRLSRLLDRWARRRWTTKARFLPQQRLAPSGWIRVDATSQRSNRSLRTKPHLHAELCQLDTAQDARCPAVCISAPPAEPGHELHRAGTALFSRCSRPHLHSVRGDDFRILWMPMKPNTQRR